MRSTQHLSWLAFGLFFAGSSAVNLKPLGSSHNTDQHVVRDNDYSMLDLLSSETFLWGGMILFRSFFHSLSSQCDYLTKYNRIYWQQPIRPRKFHHILPRQTREYHLSREILPTAEINTMYSPQSNHEFRRRPGLSLWRESMAMGQ